MHTLSHKIHPFESKTVTVYFEKPDRLPKVFRREQCSESRAKKLGMELLISAASWAGNKPKPSKWAENRFGIWYAVADSHTGRFKVEITDTANMEPGQATASVI